MREKEIHQENADGEAVFPSGYLRRYQPLERKRFIKRPQMDINNERERDSSRDREIRTQRER